MKKKKRTKNSMRAASPLSSLEMFCKLPADAVRSLENNTAVQNVRAGQVLFKTGDEGDAVYLLEKVSVQTFRDVDGRKLITSELTAPAVFGVMSCAGRRVSHCSAQTTEASRIRVIGKQQMDALLKKHPSVSRKLLDLISERFVTTLLELETSSFRQMIPRLARLLMKKAEGDCVRDLTHREIAERLRVYRETATSALGELRKAGIIEVGRKRIRILNRRRLERAARERM